MRVEVATVKARISTLAGVAVLFATAGCGGGGDAGGGETCGVAPCGGDVVGNWKASSACLDRSTLSMDILAGISASCPSGSLGVVSMTPSGMLALADDKTFTGTLTVSSMTDINYPAACLHGGTCAQATQALQTTVGTNGLTSVSCTGTSSCTCTMAQTIDIVNASGTWATSGTTLTFAGAPGGDGPYCVQGSSLHLVGFDLATMTRVVSDFVLTKQ